MFPVTVPGVQVGHCEHAHVCARALTILDARNRRPAISMRNHGSVSPVWREARRSLPVTELSEVHLEAASRLETAEVTDEEAVIRDPYQSFPFQGAEHSIHALTGASDHGRKLALAV